MRRQRSRPTRCQVLTAVAVALETVACSISGSRAPLRSDADDAAGEASVAVGTYVTEASEAPVAAVGGVEEDFVGEIAGDVEEPSSGLGGEGGDVDAPGDEDVDALGGEEVDGGERGSTAEGNQSVC